MSIVLLACSDENDGSAAHTPAPAVTIALEEPAAAPSPTPTPSVPGQHLETLDYPRLGNVMQGSTEWVAFDGGGTARRTDGGPTYTVQEVERRLAFSDVVLALAVQNQIDDPDLKSRLLGLNPNLVLLPYRSTHEQTEPDPYFQVSPEWIVNDTAGEPVLDKDWPSIKKLNISEFSPEVNGKTFNDYLVDWVLNVVFSSSTWDGIFFDNLFGRINPHIPNHDDASLLDYDYNRNGIRDETPAAASEMTRSASIYVLTELRKAVGDTELITGNNGPNPETAFASLVNGFLFECFNDAWGNAPSPATAEAAWRSVLDDYFFMLDNSRRPQLNILEGCGHSGNFAEPGDTFFEPTARDIAVHRFTMGTALLGNGFYEYDLFDARSAPYWFDEFTVNGDGIAAEDPSFKGYLGAPLGDAVELASYATAIWEMNFEAGRLPSEMWAGEGVYVSSMPEEVIEGASLVLHNPDHAASTTDLGAGTNGFTPSLVAGQTYVIEFDWLVLESLDGIIKFNISGPSGVDGNYIPSGVIKGDRGRARFHMTVTLPGERSLGFFVSGGGKVAIDNIVVTEGGTGPWRRDFENGLVLVNPINRPYTFTQAELEGELGRSGIKRILGTQAPDVNNGQPVTEALTLQPFDAVILLARHLDAP